MKLNLVDDWRDALRWFSVNIPLANTAFLVTWANLPAKFQDVLPVWAVLSIAVALLILGIFGRLLNQGE